MTQPRQGGDAESQWQQPSFEPADDRAGDAGPGRELAVPSPETGGKPVPADRQGPPSVLESTLNVVNSVLWPVLIGLVFVGVGNWMLNIVIAIIASTALGAVASEVKRRRKYLPPTEGDLR